MQRFAWWVVFALAAGCSADTSDIFGSDGSGGNGSTTGAGGSKATSTTAAGVTTGASTAETTGASTAVSTGSGPMGPTTYCNGVPCQPGQVCCYSNSIIGNDMCGAQGQCPVGTSQLACNGPDDCPEGQCCGAWSQIQGWQYTKCAAACQAGERVMCFGNNVVCNGAMCLDSQALGLGYKYCGG